MEAALSNLVLGIGIPFLFTVFLLEGMLIGKLIPTDLILPIALLGLGNSYLDYIMIIMITASSSTLGQFLLYKMLSKQGLEEVKKNKYIKIKGEYLDKADEYFEKYGDKSIAISNCVPGIRGFLTIPAAIHGIPAKKFVGMAFTGTLFLHLAIGSITLGIFSAFT